MSTYKMPDPPQQTIKEVIQCLDLFKDVEVVSCDTETNNLDTLMWIYTGDLQHEHL